MFDVWSVRLENVVTVCSFRVWWVLSDKSDVSLKASISRKLLKYFFNSDVDWFSPDDQLGLLKLNLMFPPSSFASAFYAMWLV